MVIVKIPANFYQQFDADFNLDVPAEAFQGWQKTNLEFDLSHTALVIMHAWDSGSCDQYPGWYHHVEYLPRAQKIVKEVFPPLLKVVRASSMPVFHVVGGGSYYKNYTGYQKIVKLAKTKPSNFDQISKDPIRKKLDQFRSEQCGSGIHNRPDIEEGFKHMDFPPEARPIGDEGIAENASQLYALCKNLGVNHLIYIGFAINWCLLLSPGGMADMTKHGMMCSTIREAVTAVENKETARTEWSKENALWRIALMYGFVFDLNDVMKALQNLST